MLYRSSRRIILIILISFCLFFYFEASGEIYKYVDKEGVIHYSNRSKNSNYKLLQVFNSFSYNKTAVRRTPSTNRNSEALNGIIEDVAEKFGQDPKLIQSIIRAESNYDTNAVSPKGAMGLMQLMPYVAESLAKELGIEFRLYIVGFDIKEATARDELEAIAKSTEGTYLDAKDSEGLISALKQTLRIEFKILDEKGQLIAQGFVGGEEIKIVDGFYTLRLLVEPVAFETKIIVKPGQKSTFIFEKKEEKWTIKENR